jgi:hypothetical protein
MARKGGLQRVERAFLSAATEPTLWNDAMDVAAWESGGFGTVLLSVDKPLLVTPVSPVLGEAHDFYFKLGGISALPWIATIQAIRIHGRSRLLQQRRD